MTRAARKSIAGAVAMTASAVVLTASFAACNPHDEGERVEVTQQECVACHRADYESADDPVHMGSFSTECADCHQTEAWRPAVEGGGHPEMAFPIDEGNHSAFECTDCHNEELGGYGGGENADCVGCHVGTHAREEMDELHRGVQVPRYPHGQEAKPNFCLACHMSGGDPVALHPEDAFPIETAPHTFACADCHNPDLGSNAEGANADCVGCHVGTHERSAMDARHSGVSGYPTANTQNFCLDCHPAGDI